MTTLDLHALALALLRPYRPGARLASGARWLSLSTESGLRLRFEVDGGVVDVELSPLAPGARYAARSAQVAFAYRTEGGRRAIDGARGRRLCAELATIVEANEAVVLELRSETRRTPRIREVGSGKLLETDPTGAYVTLSPYVGCLIGCRFCYAQSPLAASRRWTGLPDVPWGSYVDVRVDAPEVLAHELDARSPRTIKFCPIVSDPYHAIEARYELTGRCLDVIAERPGWRVLISTRSALVLRDLPRFARLDVQVGVSLPTADDAARRHFEPRAASVSERVEVLRTLRGAGIRTFAIVQPMLPGPLDALAELLNAYADSVTLDVLRGMEGAAEDFADRRYAHAASPAWQRARLDGLRRRLRVPLWDGELPPW